MYLCCERRYSVETEIVSYTNNLFDRSEEPLMTWRIKGANNVPMGSNIYSNKCFVFLTLSKEWTDSQKLIEKLSDFFHTLPVFVIMVHYEDDQGWADPVSKTSHLRYPTLHLTREKVKE